MLWNQYLTYKNGNETTRDLHVLNVYKDPDFRRDIAYIAKIGPDPISAPFTERFLKDVIKDKPDDKELRTLADLAKRYCVTLDEVMHFLMGGLEMPLPRDNESFKVDWEEYGEEKFFSITLYPEQMKKDDLADIWSLIQRKKHLMSEGKTTKRKPAENDTLLYAVFKARARGLKFSEIFKHYETGTLQGYSGGSSQFITAKSLERYYNKYKPAAHIEESSD